MASYMDPSRLEQFLVHILTPVYRIAEEDVVHDPQMGTSHNKLNEVYMNSSCSLDELKTLAIELQDLLQSRVGTTKFAATYNRIRQSVLGVQRERKAARVLQVCNIFFVRSLQSPLTRVWCRPRTTQRLRLSATYRGILLKRRVGNGRIMPLRELTFVILVQLFAQSVE
jgi:hypothetical protein